MMDDTEKLVESIIKGIMDKKGNRIAKVDLRAINDTICRYFVICQAQTPNQLLAIADSIRETTRIGTGQKPMTVDGEQYAHWIAMDYCDVMVHLFIPELRSFYDLEHLWADALITEIPDEMD